MKTTYLVNKLLDALYRGQAYTYPSALYIGLFTTAPTIAGGGTEVSGGAYARVALSPTSANWSSTGGAGSTTVPSAGTSGQISNNVAINFATPTASWGTVTSFALFDGASGNMLDFANLTTPIAIGSGVSPVSFAAGSLVLGEA